MTRIWALLTMLLLAAPAPAYDIGPPVGSKAPALMVTDSAGKPQSVKSLTGKNGLVLVFFRSAKWCPYCQAQLLSLRGAPATLAERGYRIAALSYDDAETLAKFAAARDIPYPLLADAGSKTIDAWQLRDKQYKSDSMAYGVPEPAIFILAPDGTIRAKLAEQGYKTRPPLTAVLAAIDASK